MPLPKSPRRKLLEQIEKLQKLEQTAKVKALIEKAREALRGLEKS